MTALPRVVHVNDKIPGAVYIGRANARKGLKGSCFRNIYRIGRDGTRAEVLEKYRDFWVRGQLRFGVRVNELIALRTAPALACWCRHDGEERTPENACHGDILIELLAQYSDDQLREMANNKAAAN